MSTFGILALFAFVILAGGLAALMYYGTDDLMLAKVMLCSLYVLTAAEFVLAIIKYPCYVIDGIVFVSMGYKALANVMFVIFGAIILFLIIFFLTKINWTKFLRVSSAKIIISGVLLLCLFAYTELFNGMGSFDSYEEFKQTKAVYEQYDVHFWPTKYIKHHSRLYNRDCVSVYPFDAKTASGRQPFVYRVDIDHETDDDGYTHYFYYPFTWKAYEGSEPVEFTDTTYVPVDTSESMYNNVSEADVSGSNVSDSQPEQ